MLVLTRKVDEMARIGEEITVTIIRIDINAVRIGLEAPDTMSIKREKPEQKTDAD